MNYRNNFLGINLPKNWKYPLQDLKWDFDAVEHTSTPACERVSCKIWWIYVARMQQEVLKLVLKIFLFDNTP